MYGSGAGTGTEVTAVPARGTRQAHPRGRVNSRIIFVGVPGKFLLGKEEEQEKILQYFCG